MIPFRTPVDIGQRAAQHVGSPLMNPALGFNDTSVTAAAQISSCYDKLRQSELKRNSWVFSIKEAMLRAIDSNTMLIVPSLWSPLTTYFRGSIVADQSNNYWRSTIQSNLGNDPLLTTLWEPYFGTLTAALYDASGTTAYSAGEVVYTTAGTGTALVYLSLIPGNSDVPGTATPYSATTTYFKDQVVTFASVAYLSLIDFNLNNEPDLAPPLFNIATTYAAGNKVGGSDGIIYQSVGSGNVGHDPTLDGGVHWTNTGVLNPWTTVFTGGTGSLNWLLIGGTGSPSGVALTTLNIQYPLGSGPSWQTSSRNAFKLPAGFLRAGYQNPKGTTTWLGGPSGNTFSDWDFESGYLISADSGPIRFRFGADVVDVSLMDAMFCEGLGTRIAFEICPSVAQSTAKQQTIAAAYKEFMGEARITNAIEVGYQDSPDDDMITCRY
jgi:hypothetical protein